MAGPIILTEDTIRRMEEEASKRAGVTVIKVEEAIEKITPEELMVRGIVATVKEVMAR